MNNNSMIPAKILQQPKNTIYRSEGRLWQGIPAIERSKKGRLFAAWYSGNNTEAPDNFVVLEKSEDDGATWTDGWIIIEHEDPFVRCFDQCLWLDPRGRLWLTWTQSWCEASGCIFDGRHGVWAVTVNNPDAEDIVFGPIRRIANGVMMNKPIVIKNGEWLFPCAVWSGVYCEPTQEHPE